MVIKIFTYAQRLHLFDLKKTNSNIVKEFSASLLQSLVSHDPSEIILIYWFVV